MEAKEETTQPQQNKDSASEANTTKEKKETKENTEDSRGTPSPVDGDGVESGATHSTSKKIGKTFWNKPEKKNIPKEDKPGNRDSWPSLEEAVTDTVVQSSSSASSTSPSTSTSTPSSPTDSSTSIPAASTSLLSTPPASTPAPLQTTTPSTNSSSSSTNKRGKKGMNWVPFKDIGPPPSSQFKNSNQQNQSHGHQNNLNNNNGHSRRRNNRDFNSDRADRGEKGERTDKGDRQERGERDRGERGERNDRGDRGERGAERGDRGDRHGDRNYRNNNFRHGRTRGRGYSNHYNNRQPTIQFPPSDRIPLFTPQYFPKEDLKELIMKQIEYYFSVENLCHDIFLRQHMDEEGYIPVSLFLTFPRIQQLSPDPSLIVESVKSSQIVECKEDKFRLMRDWKTWLIPKASALLNTPVTPAPNSAEKAEVASSA